MTAVREAAEVSPLVVDSDQADDLSQLFSLLRNATGTDFAHYKQTTVRRRIARRMLVQKIESRSDYLAF